MQQGAVRQFEPPQSNGGAEAEDERGLYPVAPGASDPAGERIWLRTLIFLRWQAIAGQILAVFIAHHLLQLNLPLGLCYLAIGASVIVNLGATFLFENNQRLRESEAFSSLMFDLSQLGFLLLVTGGLTNPFSVLILAPVTVSASALALRPTLLLGLVAMVIITLMAFVNIPILLPDGETLSVPPLFIFGFWLAIMVGLAFLGAYNHRIAREARALSDALLATQMALAREQKLTDLGGVIAAAAHELGTPLATIKLTSSELIDELDDRPDLREDARLIRQQADRCRDILREMGRAGKDDRQLHQAPVSAVLREAAEPHMMRGKEVIFELRPSQKSSAPPDGREPVIRRTAELIHGLRNFIQNAVDFAESKVWVECAWCEKEFIIRITDDGPGYPPSVLHRIGDPFVRPRRGEAPPGQRGEYEGMGLGLFIAKTLLERKGARLTFANASTPYESPDPEGRKGAMVIASWDPEVILAPAGATGAPNAHITG